MAAKSDVKETPPAQVIPKGTLQNLLPGQIVPSKNNPRRLFDSEPLKDLRDNIRVHGVLVPITVYPLKGSEKYGILDGERRHRCCVQLEKEGILKKIPANIVEPPTMVAGLLYMFSIHNFREQWELMPTALSLQIVIKELGEEDNKKLGRLTGLSEAQIERCKKLLQFPKEFQDLSLDPDPRTRVPSNFWIEALPVIHLAMELLPDLAEKLGRDGITQKLVEKYRAKQIKSVIHFRRIMEAHLYAEDTAREQPFVDRLRLYILNIDLETRRAFDEFVVDNRRIQNAIGACKSFIDELQKYRLYYTADKEQLLSALRDVDAYVTALIAQMEGTDAPPPPTDDSEEVES
jgi:ParB/RepB/Spo0J family partition protein